MEHKISYQQRAKADTYKTGKIFYHTKWNELCLLWFKNEASFKRLKNRFEDCYFIGEF